MLLDDKMLEINQTFTANDNEDAQGMEEENLFDDWVGSASPELDASGGAEGFTVNQKRRRSNVVVIINCVTILVVIIVKIVFIHFISLLLSSP